MQWSETPKYNSARFTVYLFYVESSLMKFTEADITRCHYAVWAIKPILRRPQDFYNRSLISNRAVYLSNAFMSHYTLQFIQIFFLNSICLCIVIMFIGYVGMRRKSPVTLPLFDIVFSE